MKSYGILIVCLSIAASVSSIEINRERIVGECAKQNGLSDEDLEKWINYQKGTEEKFLCFMLCCHKKDGSLDKDGKWNKQFLDQHLNDMYLINDTLKTQIMECFSNIPPIQSCQDMTAVDQCIPEITMRNCPEEFGIRNEDLENFARNPGEPSEQMLCYLKCSAENDDLIFEDGTLNLRFLEELIGRSKNMAEEEKSQVERCLSNVPPVKTCSDFLPFAKCVVNMNLF